MNYVRFITPWWRVRRHVDCGPFGPTYDAWRDERVPEVLRVAIGEEIDWFERNLPVPKPRQQYSGVRGKNPLCATKATRVAPSWTAADAFVLRGGPPPLQRSGPDRLNSLSARNTLL